VSWNYWEEERYWEDRKATLSKVIAEEQWEAKDEMEGRGKERRLLAAHCIWRKEEIDNNYDLNNHNYRRARVEICTAMIAMPPAVSVCWPWLQCRLHERKRRRCSEGGLGPQENIGVPVLHGRTHSAACELNRSKTERDGSMVLCWHESLAEVKRRRGKGRMERGRTAVREGMRLVSFAFFFLRCLVSFAGHEDSRRMTKK
jgi:hypothetical protein